MKFSFLIANFNNGIFIQTTIESILNQNYQDFEIVVVDDKSTDNSLDIISSFSDKRIRVFQNSINMGCGFTKARCVELAFGEICGFVDPEDCVTPDALEKIIPMHVSFPDASIVFSNYFHCNELLEVVSVRKPRVDPGILNSSQLYDRVINHFATFKKSLYLKTDGINSNILRAVDQDLYIKLEEVGEVVYIDETLYFYRYHKGGISAFGNNNKALYWYFLIKKEACERRGISSEDFFSKEFDKISLDYKSSLDFRIGKMILFPVRTLRTFILRIFVKK